MISTIQTTVLSLDVVDRGSNKQHLLPESQIRDIIKKFLQQCGLVFPVCPKHAEFKALCISEAIDRGYITAENNVFKRFIDAGVSMACNAYPHQRKTIQIYICLYTAFLVYLDDMFENDIEAVKEFNHRFITHQPQKREVLDHFSSLLLEMPDLFGMVQANMMITSTLNLVTALSLEYELKDTKLEPSAYHYPTFSRVMSGASETYSLFIYPPEVALKKHLQALPDCMIYINNGNDILSFYKEDLSGETTNRVYMLAQCQGVSQETVLQGLIDEAVESHKRVLQILKADKDAYDAYVSFSQGYIGFHAGLKRYKLDELEL